MAIPESARLFMSGLIERARKLKKTVAFPEGDDPRVIEAAARLAREGLVRPVLVGPTPPQAPAGVEFVDPAKSPLAAKYAALYYERRRAKGITQVEAEKIARKPLYTPSVPTRARASSPAYSSWRCPIARSATTASSPSPIAPS
jgi:phosphate acetyltransferase